nr:NAD-glutamate dehydrogenase [Planctomycetota bacterium]
MTIGLLERKAELIERVAQRVRERLEPERAGAPERFVRRFYAHVAPGDVVNDTPDNLFGAALGLWQLGQQRDPGVANVRVYTPRLDEHGWQSSHTIVELVTDDMPFILESVTAYLNHHDAEVRLAIHPIIQVERDAAHTLVDIHQKLEDADGTVRESYMHIEVSEQLEARHEELRAGVERVLADVRAAVEDFPAMHARCGEIAEELGMRGDHVQENVDFLRWLLEDHFTFLGFRRYDFEGDRAVVVKGTGLGILRPDLAAAFTGLLTGGQRPVEIQQAAPLRITKANRTSTVHRPVRLDTIGVQCVDDDGNVVGEHLFIGLFTARAYAQSPREIPILRGKVDYVVQKSDFHSESYNFKTLAYILDSYPRDELFQMSAEELYDISLGVLDLQERPHIAFFPRHDPFGRFVSCLVYVPREQYDTDFRLRIQKILTQAYDGEILAYYTMMQDTA